MTAPWKWWGRVDRGSSWPRVELTRVEFDQGSSWSRVELTKGPVDRGSSWPGSSLLGSSWPGSSLLGSSWPGSSLLGSSWPRSSLLGSSWPGSSLLGSSWPGSSLLTYTRQFASCCFTSAQKLKCVSNFGRPRSFVTFCTFAAGGGTYVGTKQLRNILVFQTWQYTSCELLLFAAGEGLIVVGSRQRWT